MQWQVPACNLEIIPRLVDELSMLVECENYSPLGKMKAYPHEIYISANKLTTQLSKILKTALFKG